jgi:hypothetical protein
MSPALFALVILEVGLAFCLGWPGPWSYYFLSFLPKLEWQAHTTMPSFFLLRWGSCKLFGLGWPWTMILLILASQVAGMTRVSHWHSAGRIVFKIKYSHYLLRRYRHGEVVKEVFDQIDVLVFFTEKIYLCNQKGQNNVVIHW